MSKKDTIVKATDKTRRKSLGGYYSILPDWKVRGKSSKHLKVIIKDMRLCISHQMGRIRRLKYVMSTLNKERRSLKMKIKTRDRAIEKLREDRATWRAKMGLLRKEIGEKRRMVESRDSEIKRLRKERGILSAKVTMASKREPKVVKEKPLPGEIRIKNMLNKPIDERLLNITDLTIKTQVFIKDRGFTMGQLTALSQVGLYPKVRKSDIVGQDKEVLKTLESKGLISSQYLGAGRNEKYWYITPDGEQALKDFKNYLSYGKGIA